MYNLISNPKAAWYALSISAFTTPLVSLACAHMAMAVCHRWRERAIPETLLYSAMANSSS